MTFYINDLSCWLSPGDTMTMLAGAVVVLTSSEAILYALPDDDDDQVEEIARKPRTPTAEVREAHAALCAWVDITLALRTASPELRARVAMKWRLSYIDGTMSTPLFRASLLHPDGSLSLSTVWKATALEALAAIAYVEDIEDISDALADEFESRNAIDPLDYDAR